VTLILILVVWIYVKVIGGSAPNGQDFTEAVQPARRRRIGAIAFASVFASSPGPIRRGGRLAKDENRAGTSRRQSRPPSR